MFKVGLIRVITLDNPEARDLHGNLIMQGYPGVHVESRCIPEQPEGIHSRELAKVAEPKVAQLARELAGEGKDMVVVSCAEDPGVALVRATAPDILIAGAGESLAGMALRCGTRVGAMGITSYAPPIVEEVLGEHLVRYERPAGIECTLDLQTPEGRQSCLDTALALKAAGATVIALACTGMATMGIAREVREATGLPTVDPILALGAAISFEAARKRLGR